MAITRNSTYGKNKTGTQIGLEEKLWVAADKMRGHVEASEYKHVVLGLVFLKYLSDIFAEHHRDSSKSIGKLEDRKVVVNRGLFTVPQEASWSFIESHIADSHLANLLDNIMLVLEDVNPSLKGVLPKTYSRISLDNYRLSELINLIGTIGLGDKSSRSKDILGRVYEYFLGRFAYTEGKGGEFYTPSSVVQLLVEMIEPNKGSVYDPCCGTGGMFVQSEKFVLAHGGSIDDLSIFGQELNSVTWRLCKMNLAIRGIDGNIGPYSADSFHNDLHPSLKADFIIANPPFNISDWGGERLRKDPRWAYGNPPNGNANFAWVQHMVHHLSSTGVAAFVLTNGSLSVGQDSSIRQSLIEADLVDCIVALPSHLFYNTQIASCIWILAKNKQDHRFRDRRGSTLFIYAHHKGEMIDRVHKELSNRDIHTIANVYRSWRSKDGQNLYQDEPGFCKSVTLEEITSHNWALVPGRYVGFDRHLFSGWDNERLRQELEDVEARLVETSHASAYAISVFKELIYG